MESNTQVTVHNIHGGYRFEPVKGAVLQPDVIFYPGGLVKPESYSTIAQKLAIAGHRVYIAKMPFNLAILKQNAADSFIKEHPNDNYIIGGHSMGGVFASRYASKNYKSIKGVYFLASYADDEGDLSKTDIAALQITGTNDGVLNLKRWEEAKTNLPEQTMYVSIKGGNHGQFGTYGFQKGDYNAAISREDQQQAVTDALIKWMNGLR
ncbi:alpha/beta fold hydrolase [Paenibacillus glycanilyticus]|uniref:Alpha/beta hydrolase fold-5 domain-containing protein n=1 Tax=Paenibacillus glycanilyticus TaxID=126569 RepID=A0ABQ6GHB8_9BACL|nr:alpha/beta fold hydrolase [Paenibacillus glycanilyticus]GLX68452.1 hypothetical protein MU1_27970 [Paenibacillus glycanilyticus]